MAKVREPIATKIQRRSSKGQVVGYVRVCTFEQNENRQLEGIKLDRKFLDKASGRDVKRAQLEALLGYVRAGDTIICHSMDRRGRNLDDLRKLVVGLTSRGIRVQFVKENLTFTDADSPMSNLLLSVMGAFTDNAERAIMQSHSAQVSPWPAFQCI